MEVELIRQDKAFHFEAKGSAAVGVQIDANSSVGGHDLGARPMELILMGLGGCSAIDVLSILKKQRQDIEDVRIVVDGTREEGVVPSVFKKIHLTYIITGTAKREKVEQAIVLSMEKYCSVTAMLRGSVEITWSLTID